MAFIIKNSRGQSYDGVAIVENICPILFNSPDKDEILEYSNEDFINLREGLYNVSKECLKYSNQRKHSIFMGGDHLASFATILASLKKYGNNFKLIWLDAHTDIHSFDTSVSWNLHGMVVRLLMTHNIKDIPQLQSQQILYIGLRSIDDEEIRFIRSHNINMITMKDWKTDKKASFEKLGDFVIYNNVHISLDVDVLDPTIMSSTGTPVDNGMSVEDVINIIHIIREYAVSHFATDIMEFNPQLGNFKVSFNTLKKIVDILK
jgi:arginase